MTRWVSCHIAGVLGVLLGACGGSLSLDDDGGVGGASEGGSGAEAPGAGASVGSGGASEPSGSGGEVSYTEPDCPDEPPPPAFRECDPLEPLLDCPEGQGCYPFIDYPFGEGCGHPSFGARCSFASTGEQGELCGDGGNYCAPGYMCVVGATGGKRCGQTCEPVAEHDCPAGLICGETDVQGYGVCF